jgi:hypothetical protein
VAFDVDVDVVGDVEHDLDDPASRELELGPVLAGDGIAAVIADAEPAAAVGGETHGGPTPARSDLTLNG